MKRGNIDPEDRNRSSLLAAGVDDESRELVASFKLNLLRLALTRVGSRNGTRGAADSNVSVMTSPYTRRAEPLPRGEPCRLYSIPT